MLEVNSNVRNHSTGDPESVSFLVQVVHLYYQRHKTQKEVAERLGVSAMTVSRALKRAEEEGLVEVRLHLPLQNDTALEVALKAKLGFREVFVVDPMDKGLSPEDWSDPSRLDLLGQATALFSQSALQDGLVLGTALGRTVSYVAKHLPRQRLRNAKVVQLMGGLGTSDAQNPYNVVQAVSERLDAQGSYFSGAAFVANKTVQSAMLQENIRSGLRDLWRACTLCLMGIGSCTLNPPPYVDSGLITEEEFSAVVRSGAVGDILGRYFNLEGRLITSSLQDRVNSIPLSDLEHINQVVISAGGPGKVFPIIGVARTGLPVSLVTDSDTARAVLKHLDAKT